MTQDQHRVETFRARHFDPTVEIWCPIVDEVKVVLGEEYVRHCVMCGSEVGR